MIRILLESGADPYAVDLDGRTALDLATFHRHGEAIELLQGAPPARPAAPQAPAFASTFEPPPPPPRAAASPAAPVFETPVFETPVFETPVFETPVFETIVIPPPDPPEVVSPVVAANVPVPEEPRVPPLSSWAPSADSFTIPLPDHLKKSQ
jgi:ankyrin repeat protein